MFEEPSLEECQAGQLTTHVRASHQGKPGSVQGQMFFRQLYQNALEQRGSHPSPRLPGARKGGGSQDSLGEVSGDKETLHTGLGSGVPQGPPSASTGFVEKALHHFAPRSLPGNPNPSVPNLLAFP